jgi:hypothetical protein
MKTIVGNFKEHMSILYVGCKKFLTKQIVRNLCSERKCIFFRINK